MIILITLVVLTVCFAGVEILDGLALALVPGYAKQELAKMED